MGLAVQGHHFVIKPSHHDWLRQNATSAEYRILKDFHGQNTPSESSLQNFTHTYLSKQLCVAHQTEIAHAKAQRKQHGEITHRAGSDDKQ